MSKSIDAVFTRVLDFGRISHTSTTYKAGQYLFENKGKNVDEVAKQYVQSGLSQSSLTRFIHAINDTIGSLILEENVEGLVTKSRQEITKIAQDKNIPLKINPKLYEDHRPEYQWFKHNALDITGLDNVCQVKESLKWANCLVEFCCGEPLFNDKNKSDTVLSTDKEESQKIENNIYPAELQKQQQEEFIYNLWKEGYLKCDLIK